MPQFKETLKALPEKYLEILLEFLSDLTTEDELHEMIICCYEAWDIKSRNPAIAAHKAIADGIKRRKCEAATIYNGRRNISLNQSFGDSRTPASDFLNLSEWREWE